LLVITLAPGIIIFKRYALFGFVKRENLI